MTSLACRRSSKFGGSTEVGSTPYFNSKAVARSPFAKTSFIAGRREVFGGAPLNFEV